MSEVERYASGNMLDTGWVAGFLAIALGAVIEHPSEEWLRSAVGAPTLPSLVAPLLPMLVALTMTAFEMRAGRVPDGPAITMAFVLIVLALVRHCSCATFSRRAATATPARSIGSRRRRWASAVDRLAQAALGHALVGSRGARASSPESGR